MREAKTSFSFFLAIAIFILTVPAMASAWTGLVVEVFDGDKLLVQRADKNELMEVRLHGVYAPNDNDLLRTQAIQFISNMTIGKMVTVQKVATDRQGNIVAIVCMDGKCLNEALLSGGHAFFYPRYCKGTVCDKFKAIENSAKDGQKGIWQSREITPPWESNLAAQLQQS
jgi:endonuclease YncB( thermonuclease family)